MRFPSFANGRALWLALSFLTISGCRFGDASFVGDLEGRSFDPGGTVFTYADSHDDNFVSEPRPRVVVFMTWLAFDANQDLNDLAGSTLEDFRHELALRDALTLIFDDQAELVPEATFTSVVQNGEETGDGKLEARFHFGPERLAYDATYEAFVPYGSHRTVSVTIEDADFTDTREVLGTLTVEFARTETDPGDARVGTLTGSFWAPVVEERLAEHNLALLGTETLLGVPLAPRVMP